MGGGCPTLSMGLEDLFYQEAASSEITHYQTSNKTDITTLSDKILPDRNTFISVIMHNTFKENLLGP